MKEDYEIKGEELHHSCTDMGVVDWAKTVMAEHRQAAHGDEVWNKWHSAKVDNKEILERGERVINDLLIIVNRLTKDCYCSKCGGTGSYMERMGGCRDDNESVVCSSCHGRFKFKKA
jgi:hypothetical protein